MSNFRELMGVRQSKMELGVAEDLQNLGFNISMSETFLLKLPDNPFYLERREIPTYPDISLLDYDLHTYIDGWEVHKNRVEKDKFLRKLLAEQYPVQVLPIGYRRYSKKRRKEIVAEIVEATK